LKERVYNFRMALQFSDTSASKNGLIQECEFLIFGEDGYGRISGDANLLATFTRNINNALNRVVALILGSNGRWQWDDTNNTDLPIGTATLVTTAGAEQQDYSFDISHIEVLRVECKDASGAWQKLVPIDQADVWDQSLTDFLKTPGMPMYYDKTGSSIFLYPKPLAAAVTASNGLKVFFQRPPNYFTTSSTTAVPGFNSLFHRLIAILAARDYALVKTMPVAKALVDLAVQGETDIQDHYAIRSNDEQLKLTTKKQRFN
jgi:hypothetical protein